MTELGFPIASSEGPFSLCKACIDAAASGSSFLEIFQDIIFDHPLTECVAITQEYVVIPLKGRQNLQISWNRKANHWSLEPKSNLGSRIINDATRFELADE